MTPGVIIDQRVVYFAVLQALERDRGVSISPFPPSDPQRLCMSVLDSAAALRGSNDVRVKTTTELMNDAFDRLVEKGFTEAGLTESWVRLCDGLGDAVDDLGIIPMNQDLTSGLPPNLAAAVRVHNADVVVTTDEQLIGLSSAGTIAIVSPAQWLAYARKFFAT